MGMFKYVTNRTVANNAGKETGKIKVVVRNDSDKAEVDYTCPECSGSRHLEQAWKRPFNVKCSKCGFMIKLPRLKGKV